MDINPIRIDSVHSSFPHKVCDLDGDVVATLRYVEDAAFIAANTPSLLHLQTVGEMPMDEGEDLLLDVSRGQVVGAVHNAEFTPVIHRTLARSR